MNQNKFKEEELCPSPYIYHATWKIIKNETVVNLFNQQRRLYISINNANWKQLHLPIQ